MDKKQKILIASTAKEMEATAARMRELIRAMPPHDLLGYIYAQRMIKSMADQSAEEGQGEPDDHNNLINENQFLLEYVHAVLSSDADPGDTAFDEGRCAELFELGIKLREQALYFAAISSASTDNGIFGPNTADIEFQAKSTWVMLRGNRYQVLEEEFYWYVLAPHDEALKDVYGVGAADIARGFQGMADATRAGHANASVEIRRQFEALQFFAAAQGKEIEDVMAAWTLENAEHSNAAALAMDDMFRGGIANVSRHTRLPPTFLADLAYERGEETEFFAAGDLAGTPYRTLPARKKPLIRLESDYYAIDPCFTRDAGYRALLYNLLRRKPDYKKTFEARQKAMSEAALPIFFLLSYLAQEFFKRSTTRIP